MNWQNRKLYADIARRNAAEPKVMRFGGSQLFRYDEVTSTQDVAREWVEKQGYPLPGAVFMAQRMTAARGRQGRVWQHPPGANAALTAVAPPVPREALWQVAMVAGLAACRAANTAAPGAQARIRFPNDVYTQGRKLAGVLVESVPFPPHVVQSLPKLKDSVVPLVGIGINVVRVPLPLDIAERAISLEAVIDSPVIVNDVEEALLSWMTSCWDQWRNDGFAALLPAWHDLLDRTALRTFIFKGEESPCRVLELQEDGMVQLESESGMHLSASAAHVLVEG